MFKFSQRELYDLGLAWLAITVAFSILYIRQLTLSLASVLLLFFITAFTAGIAFLFHELAHKFVANKYGFVAEFFADKKQLLFMIVISLFGIVFAAPGAVWIQGNITRRKNGIISMAGPLTNLVLAILFLVPTFFVEGIFGFIGSVGFRINAWLGLFNMIPFAMFDGAKIWNWNKFVWFALTILLLVFTVMSFLI